MSKETLVGQCGCGSPWPETCTNQPNCRVVAIMLRNSSRERGVIDSLAAKDAAYQSAVNGRAEMRQALRDSRAEIAALTAERDALKADAGRYRWLDASGLFAQPQGYDTQVGIAASDEPEGILFINNIRTHIASTAIDAAIAKDREK